MTRRTATQLEFDLSRPVVRCWMCRCDMTAQLLPEGSKYPGLLEIDGHLHPDHPGDRCLGSGQVCRPDRCSLSAHEAAA